MSLFTISHKDYVVMSSSIAAAIRVTLGIHIHARKPCGHVLTLEAYGKRVAVTIHGKD